MMTLSLKVSKTLSMRLETAARRRNSSKSDIIREALLAYLSHNNPHASSSVAEMTKEFIGCLDSAPNDLSFNKKHMKGFGS